MVLCGTRNGYSMAMQFNIVQNHLCIRVILDFFLNTNLANEL